MKKFLIVVLLVLIVATGALTTYKKYAPRPTSIANGTPILPEHSNQVAAVRNPTRTVSPKASQLTFQKASFQSPASGFSPQPNTAQPVRFRSASAVPTSSLVHPQSNVPHNRFGALPVVAHSPSQNQTPSRQFTRPASPISNSKFGTTRLPVRVKARSNTNTFTSAPATKAPLPLNARNVKTLVRANYHLPHEAAKILENFFALDKAQNIETVIDGDESDPLVDIQVTTDADTQRAVAMFLNAVYTPERIEKIKTKSEKQKDDSETSDASDGLQNSTVIDFNETIKDLQGVIDQTRLITPSNRKPNLEATPNTSPSLKRPLPLKRPMPPVTSKKKSFKTRPAPAVTPKKRKTFFDKP